MNPATEPRNVLDVHDLTVRYGSHTAVDQLGFQVEAGEIFGLSGNLGTPLKTIVHWSPAGSTARLFHSALLHTGWSATDTKTGRGMGAGWSTCAAGAAWASGSRAEDGKAKEEDGPVLALDRSRSGLQEPRQRGQAKAIGTRARPPSLGRSKAALACAGYILIFSALGIRYFRWDTLTPPRHRNHDATQ